jgi:hypothetical protein
LLFHPHDFEWREGVSTYAIDNVEREMILVPPVGGSVRKDRLVVLEIGIGQGIMVSKRLLALNVLIVSIRSECSLA